MTEVTGPQQDLTYNVRFGEIRGAIHSTPTSNEVIHFLSVSSRDRTWASLMLTGLCSFLFLALALSCVTLDKLLNLLGQGVQHIRLNIENNKVRNTWSTVVCLDDS